jgi:hypothetical protein
LLDPAVSFERVWHELNDRRGKLAAASSIEALMYELRTHGTAQLKDAVCQRRLSDLHEKQLHEVCMRLQKLKSEIATPRAAEAIEQLVKAWVALHE